MRTFARKRGAFTLAELLIALALMAMLMTAAAMGIYAAQVSHRYNAEKSELVARARGVLDRVGMDVRKCAEVSAASGRVLTLAMADGTTRSYEWDGINGGNLTITVSDGVTPQTATLTRHVHYFAIDGSASPAVCVQLQLTGEVSETSNTITATPRRAVF